MGARSPCGAQSSVSGEEGRERRTLCFVCVSSSADADADAGALWERCGIEDRSRPFVNLARKAVREDSVNYLGFNTT